MDNFVASSRSIVPVVADVNLKNIGTVNILQLITLSIRITPGVAEITFPFSVNGHPGLPGPPAPGPIPVGVLLVNIPYMVRSVPGGGETIF